MQSVKALLLIVLSLPLIAPCCYDSGPSFCLDKKRRFEQCRVLLVCENCTSPNQIEPNDGNKQNQYCVLLKTLYSYSAALDKKNQAILIDWIEKTQAGITDSSDLTDCQILVKIHYSLKFLFESHPDIKKVLKYAYISNWGGYVFQLESLAKDLESQIIEADVKNVITVENYAMFPLIAALNNISQYANQEEQMRINQLVNNIIAIIKANHPPEITLILIYKEFRTCFEQGVTIRNLIFNVKYGYIKGLGFIQGFYDICHVLYRIKHFSVATGGAIEECALMKILNQLEPQFQSSSSEDQQFKQLKASVQEYFGKETNPQLRAQFFTQRIYLMYSSKNDKFKIIFSARIERYGSIYDLIYAYLHFGYCSCNSSMPSSNVPGQPGNNVLPPDVLSPPKINVSPPNVPGQPGNNVLPPDVLSPPKINVPPPNVTDEPVATTVLNMFSPNVPSESSISTSSGKTDTVSNNESSLTTNDSNSKRCAWIPHENTAVEGLNTTNLLQPIIADQVNWSKDNIEAFDSSKNSIYKISVNDSLTPADKFKSIKRILKSVAKSSPRTFELIAKVNLAGFGTVKDYMECE